MYFVPVKTAEQQTGLMMVGVRDRLIRNRTQLPTLSVAMPPSSA
jgi:transposase